MGYKVGHHIRRMHCMYSGVAKATPLRLKIYLLCTAVKRVLYPATSNSENVKPVSLELHLSEADS